MKQSWIAYWVFSLGLSGCWKGTDPSPEVVQFRAFAAVGAKPLEFKLGPGIQRLSITTYGITLEKALTSEIEPSFPYEFHYQILGESDKVLREGMASEWTKEATNAISEDEDTLVPLRLKEGGPGVLLSAHQLSLDFGDTLRTPTRLKILGVKAAPELQTVLFRVSAKSELADFRRRLEWARTAPEIKLLLSGLPKALLASLNGREIKNIMRWRSEARAPSGVEQEDFVEYPLIPGEVTGNVVSFDSKSLILPSSYRVYESEAAQSRTAHVCLKAATDASAQVQAWNYPFQGAQPVLLATLPASNKAESQSFGLPPGTLVLKSDKPVFAYFAAKNGAKPSGCGLRLNEFVKDTAFSMEALQIPAKQPWQFAVNNQLEGEEATVYRLELVATKGNAKAPVVAFKALDENGHAVRTQSWALPTELSPFMRLNRRDVPEPLPMSLTRFLRLPNNVTQVQIIADQDILATLSHTAGLKAPFTVLDTKPVAVNAWADASTSSWWPIMANEWRARFEIVTVSKQRDVLSETKAFLVQDGRGIEPQRNLPGQVFLEKTVLGKEDASSLASLYGQFTDQDSDAEIYLQPMVRASGAKLFFSKQNDQLVHVSLTIDGDCLWQGQVAGRYGEVQLPPFIGERIKVSTHRLTFTSEQPITVWTEGIHRKSSNSELFKKRFYYQTQVGESLPFRFVHQAGLDEHQLVFHAIPAIDSKEPLEFKVSLQKARRLAREVFDDWTIANRVFRIRSYDTTVKLQALANVTHESSLSPAFVFPIGRDLMTGDYDVTVQQIAGDPAFISGAYVYPSSIGTGNLKVSYDRLRTSQPPGSCRIRG